MCQFSVRNVIDPAYRQGFIQTFVSGGEYSNSPLRRTSKTLRKLRLFRKHGLRGGTVKVDFEIQNMLCVVCAHSSGFRHPGTYPKKTRWVFWVHPPKKPTPKKPHFYFNLILVYSLYANNNAIFYCFKAFKALSY